MPPVRLLGPPSDGIVRAVRDVMNAMKLPLIAVLLFLFSMPISGWSQEQEQSRERRTVQAAALNQILIIGTLGIPLGQAAVIEARIVSGGETRKADTYLLRITSIDGVRLEKPLTMDFCVPGFADARLAHDVFRLYELRNGHKAGRLTSHQIEKLEKGYLGREVKLVVYESGRFRGMPAGLPEDAPVWQDTPFHFSTHLVVLKQRE
jgi:hypothetical protein